MVFHATQPRLRRTRYPGDLPDPLKSVVAARRDRTARRALSNHTEDAENAEATLHVKGQPSARHRSPDLCPPPANFDVRAGERCVDDCRYPLRVDVRTPVWLTVARLIRKVGQRPTVEHRRVNGNISRAIDMHTRGSKEVGQLPGARRSVLVHVAPCELFRMGRHRLARSLSLVRCLCMNCKLTCSAIGQRSIAGGSRLDTGGHSAKHAAVRIPS